jgi:hypothetical protein
MTDEGRGMGGTVGPPWSVDLLADLHAGVLDEREAARLWPRVEADPEARAVLDALDATTTELAHLRGAPVEPMPADIAARLDAAISTEAQQRSSHGPEGALAPVRSLDAARGKRRRRLGWAGGVLTAAAAAVVAVSVIDTTGGPGDDPVDRTPKVAQPAPDQNSPGQDVPALTLSGDNPQAAVGDVSGVRDFGPLGNEERLDACLAANGIDPEIRPAGFRPATVDGQEALLVLLTTGNLAELRIVALPATCGPDNPGTLFDKVVGGTGN